MALKHHFVFPNGLAFTRQAVKLEQATRNSIALDGGDHFGVAGTAVVGATNLSSGRGVDDEARDLVVVPVHASFWMNEWMRTSDHVHQRPEPRRPVFVMTMKPVDDGAPLDVHRVHGDFIGLFGHRTNPFDAMVQGIGLVHEGGFEHQVGLDTEVELLSGSPRLGPMTMC